MLPMFRNPLQVVIYSLSVVPLQGTQKYVNYQAVVHFEPHMELQQEYSHVVSVLG